MSQIEGAVRLAKDISSGVALVVQDCKLPAFPMTSFVRTHVVSLDLSGNKIQDASALGGGGCWIRHLSLANNKLNRLPSLTHMQHLVHLDLSYNDDLALVLWIQRLGVLIILQCGVRWTCIAMTYLPLLSGQGELQLQGLDKLHTLEVTRETM